MGKKVVRFFWKEKQFSIYRDENGKLVVNGGEQLEKYPDDFYNVAMEKAQTHGI
jgi:hypothetical protein